MDLLSELTPAQLEAVTHVDGPLLVLAGAGSGKTRVITRRVAYLQNQGVAGGQILALTFTNKAAGEMRHRIAALVPNSNVWVGTFHGLCARLLRTYAPLVGVDRGFTIYDQSDRVRAIKIVMEQLGLDGVGVTPEKVESILSHAKNKMIAPADFKHRADMERADQRAAAAVYEVYQEKLRAASAIDFDDLLLHMVTVLRENSDVRRDLDRRFRYVLVDEYQDTNLAQYAIVRALSMDYPNLCATGDPDQSIYGWRGANLGNILEFEHDFPGCKVVKLERNYRSTKTILQVADELIRNNRMRKAKSLHTENPVGAPVELTIYGSEKDEAEGVASKIVELTREGDYRLNDCAIFVRVNAMTRPVELALRSANLPYQVVGGLSFYERQEVKDVLAYLNLLVNPKDDVAFERIVNVPPRGIGGTTIAKLKNYAVASGQPLRSAARSVSPRQGLQERAVRALREFSELMDQLESLRELTAHEALSQLLDRTGYYAHLEANSAKGDVDRTANLDELVTAARQFDTEHPGATIHDFLEDISLASAVDRWTEEDGAVTLMSLHAAKGLEFPVVFVIGLEKKLIPHERSLHDNGMYEEERRLLFVGITRAREELYLSHCLVRQIRGQRVDVEPSGFLQELPEERLVVRDLSALSSDPMTPRRREPRPPIHWPSRPAIVPSRISSAENGAGAGDGLERFHTGLTVLHPEYGLGRIIAIDGAGPNRKGRVRFAIGSVEKTFVLSMAPLQPIGGAF